MRLVLAGHRRPLTWVRHAGGGGGGWGGLLQFQKIIRNKEKLRCFIEKEVGVVSVRKPLSPLLLPQLLSPPSCPRSAVPFVFTLRFCLSRKRAPPSRRTRSCGYILRPALQPPSSPQNMPPLGGLAVAV